MQTRYKIKIAQYLSQGVLRTRQAFGQGEIAEVRRRGVTWRLDLREGIDLSIYLFGSFEPLTVRTYSKIVRPGDTVLDIGANIGAHTLLLARRVGQLGKVIAFEPTLYAFEKLQQNVALNPELSSRTELMHSLLVAPDTQVTEQSIYSSWPLEEKAGLHEKHRGQKMSIGDAQVITLDQYIQNAGIPRIHFIKLDVDGNEISILSGAQDTLEKHRPHILLEFAPYLFEDREKNFGSLVNALWAHGYQFSNANNGKALPTSVAGIQRLIPDGASLNVIARHESGAAA